MVIRPTEAVKFVSDILVYVRLAQDEETVVAFIRHKRQHIIKIVSRILLLLYGPRIRPVQSLHVDEKIPLVLRTYDHQFGKRRRVSLGECHLITAFAKFRSDSNLSGPMSSTTRSFFFLLRIHYALVFHSLSSGG